jgi:transporter family-2 protein
MTIGVLTAISAGIMFGTLTAIEGLMARSIGPVNASLVEHLAAGVLSVVALVFVISRKGLTLGEARLVLPLAAVASVLVIVAVAAIAFSLPKIGVATGNLALVFGQMAVAIAIDTFGIGGYEKIPLSPSRVLGLLLLAAGVYLVLPRNG